MSKAIAIKLAAVLASVACVLWLPAPWGWIGLAAVCVLATALIAWAVFDVNSSFWARTLWRAPAATKAVALTFDDGPDPEFTPRVLEILREKKVTAAFFCVGARVREHPQLARQILEAGHTLGNHSDSHAMWINFSFRAALDGEIKACNEAIKEAAGVVPSFYRAPHGFKNPSLGDALKAAGMVAIGWQVRGFDAVVSNAASIAQRIVEKAKPGGVILLHDGAGLQGSPDRKATLEALPVVIDGLKARGLEIVPLPKLLGVEPYGAQGDSIMALPSFKYHPDPVATGHVEESDIKCACCRKRRGYVYTGPVHEEDGYDSRICPWCIADGSAHDKFGVTFTDEVGIGGGGEWEEVPQEVIEEITCRTPGFNGWQQERWWTHCGDAAMFLGRAGRKELEGLGPAAIAAIRDSTGLLEGPEWEKFFSALDKDGSPTAYIFRCTKCGLLGGYQDCD